MASLTPRTPATTERLAPLVTRPASVPRPTTASKAPGPSIKPSAASQQTLADKVPEPPPAPRRPIAKPSRRSPPPLPKPVLLVDADLIDDEDVTHVARTPIPTSFDVEIDCFTCTEPPPESRPRRKRSWLALVTGLVLVAATGVSLWARSAAPQLAAASPTPPVAGQTSPAPNVRLKSLDAQQPCLAASAATRPKQSAPSKRAQTVLASAKKPSKPLRPQAAPPRARALY